MEKTISDRYNLRGMMAQRWRDWLAQAEHDLEQAAASRKDGRHDWACFASHQAAEKAVKAIHVAGGQRKKGHIVARLLSDLSETPPEELVDKGGCSTTTICRRAVPGAIRKGRPMNTTARFRASRDCDLPVISFSLSVKRWSAKQNVTDEHGCGARVRLRNAVTE